MRRARQTVGFNTFLFFKFLSCVEISTCSVSIVATLRCSSVVRRQVFSMTKRMMMVHYLSGLKAYEDYFQPLTSDLRATMVRCRIVDPSDVMMNFLSPYDPS